MKIPPTVLAATVHDPKGRMASAMVALAKSVRAVFADVALNISDATAPDIAVIAETMLGARVMHHAAGEGIIGRARRDAVRLALGDKPILHADFDHLLRWVEHGRDELARVLSEQAEVEFLVVGRSATAMAGEPRRLRETERLVNHTHGLMNGNHWDLMFAIRRLSPRAAQLIVDESRVDTLANDAEWPLLARRAGLRLGYAESDVLFYRTIEEFGAEADGGDGDPLEWIRRIEFAALQAAVMRQYLDPA